MWTMRHHANREGECVCCQEHDQITDKIVENDTDISCIAQHEGFDVVCLNRWVLQTGYFNTDSIMEIPTSTVNLLTSTYMYKMPAYPLMH